MLGQLYRVFTLTRDNNGSVRRQHKNRAFLECPVYPTQRIRIVV